MTLSRSAEGRRGWPRLSGERRGRQASEWLRWPDPNVASSLHVYAVAGGNPVMGSIDIDRAPTFDYEDQNILLGIHRHPVTIPRPVVHALDTNRRLG